MRKIMQAARRHCGEMDHEYAQRLSFIAGARYVLDAMTSEEAAETAVNSINDVWMYEARKLLAAVRKEIEGE